MTKVRGEQLKAWVVEHWKGTGAGDAMERAEDKSECGRLDRSKRPTSAARVSRRRRSTTGAERPAPRTRESGWCLFVLDPIRQL